MHLRNFPHIYKKDGQEVKAYYTVEALELRAAGWVRDESAESVAEEAVEEIEDEVEFEEGAEEEDEEVLEDEVEEETEEPVVGDVDFEAMTKRELLEYAKARGVDLPDNDLKADLIKACKEL